MPDLSYDAVMGWLKERDPVAAAVALPGPVDDVQPAMGLLLTLGNWLDDMLPHNPEGVAGILLQPDMRQLMDQIGMVRRLRLLEWVKEVKLPNYQGVQDALADPEEMAALERLEILRSLFSPERIAELRAACERAKEGSA